MRVLLTSCRRCLRPVLLSITVDIVDLDRLFDHLRVCCPGELDAIDLDDPLRVFRVVSIPAAQRVH